MALLIAFYPFLYPIVNLKKVLQMVDVPKSLQNFQDSFNFQNI